MPQGPFGLPRLTEIPPFSSDEVEVILEEDREPASFRRFPKELRDLVNEKGIDDTKSTRVERRVVVRQRPEETGIDVVDEIKGAIAEFGERAAWMQYYFVEQIGDENVGYIQKTEVDRRFRRKGIASDLRKTALEDMENMGADIIYTFPVTDAGEELARSQGFSFEQSDVQGYMARSF